MRCRTCGVVGEPDQVLDHLLAGVIRRVRLAGNHQLDRMRGVQQQLLQPRGIPQHQGQPLVGRNAPGKADGEYVRIQHGVRPGQLRVRGAALLPCRAQPPPNVMDQRFAQDPAQRPDVRVGNVEGLAPVRAVQHARAEALGRQGAELRVHPGGHMHAIGHRGDGDFSSGRIPARARRTSAGKPRRAVWPRHWPAAPAGAPSRPY